MTAALTAKEIVSHLGEKFPGTIEEAGPDSDGVSRLYEYAPPRVSRQHTLPVNRKTTRL